MGKNTINYVTGCTCSSLSINDIESYDMNITDLQNIAKQLIRLNFNNINEIIFDFVVDIISYDPKYKNSIRSNYDDTEYVFLYERILEDDIISFCDIFCDYRIYINYTYWEKDITEHVLSIIDKLIDSTEDRCIYQTFIKDIVQRYGQIEHGYPYHCDCCGDYVYSYKFKF